MLTNSNLYLHSPRITTTIHFHNRDYKLFRRRRLKQPRRKTLLTVRNQLSNQSSFDYLVSHINSLDLIAPTLGLVFGVAYYLSNSKNERIDIFNSNRKESEVYDVGEWMLFTSPTLFNRFVVLQCPSIELEVANDVNEKLVKEDKHYVRIREVERDVDEVRVVYQRKCVMTDNGGVISLDWLDNLELCDEHGLDTMIVIIAGTSEGSMDDNVMRFVDECVKR